MRKKSLKRIAILACGVFFLFSLLIVYFFNIQIINGAKWSQAAKKQHFFIVSEPFRRGAFWSHTQIRKGHPDKPQRFVMEIEQFHLMIDPLSIPVQHRDAICRHLEENVDFSAGELKKLRSQFDMKSRSRKVAMWLDFETKERLLTWWNGYANHYKIPRNALYFIPEYRRSYPFGRLLGQVLQTVQSQKDEKTQQACPTGGLELYFDAYLKGNQGKRLLKRSPRHSFETGQMLASPEDGADVYLTINHCLQAIVEEELELGVRKCSAKDGWAIMMEPHTGEILAFAQYPFYYPSEYKYYFNDPELMEHAKVKAVVDPYEPGSVMKPFTVLIALLANKELIARGEPPLFDPEKMMPCSDGFLPGRRIPLKDGVLYKYMNMSTAIQKSANIYPARLVQRIIERLGPEWYRSALSEFFGFGKKTGIELPSESPGLLPRPGRLHPNGTLEWSMPTPYNLAIGYNLQVNSIQLLCAYSLLANGGTLVKPTLVRKILKRDYSGKETVLLDHTHDERLALFKKNVDPQLVKQVVAAMKYNTKPGGLGFRGDIPGYTQSGKTGTAHKSVNGGYSQTLYIASFIGFAPVENPAFVLLVVMNEPEKKWIPGAGNNHHGSLAAAPVFSAIALRSLEYLGVPQDDPHRQDWMAEAKALKKLHDEWNK